MEEEQEEEGVTRWELVVGLEVGLAAEMVVGLLVVVKVSVLLFAWSVSSLEDLKWKQRDREQY